jgi:phosphoadenosine phosphosulfate reductase
MENDQKLNEVKNLLHNRQLAEAFTLLSAEFSGKIVFTTSFGIEDQVISHFIFSSDIPVKVATLDTGRLFPETYKVYNETVKKYGKKIDLYFPNRDSVEEMVSEKGPFSFYYSKENRLECCRLRKVVPLNRVLNGMECWISGIRAEQSDNRGKMESVEYDSERKLYKIHPLFDWTFDEVKLFTRENQIPYNILHDKGFVSIGCEPCTRAVSPGEDFRAGRWWWEQGGEKECGVHLK